MLPLITHLLYMVQDYNLRLLPEEAATDENLRQSLIRESGLDASHIRGLRVVRRNIDARQRKVVVNVTARVWVDEEMPQMEFESIDYPSAEGRPTVIVVGAGPGGLFAALRLIELGLRPIVVERGKDVHARKRDLARIAREHTVDPESNYSFGEGGAGAYSDGKLFTRSKKRGSVDKILRVLCQHGAQTTILADAHPHIGTDRLPRVIEHIRQTIQQRGGEVRFQTCMTDLLLRGGAVVGCVCHDHEAAQDIELNGPVILATGHSARDVYRLLAARGIDIEAKGIAVGVRLEHPATLIDQIQYHSREGRGRWLPAAEYAFVRQVEGRGVYSFCMCPGGVVVPAASGPGQVVVNGMSPCHRGGRWSNSGMVVEVRPEDMEQLSHELGTNPDFLAATGGKADATQHPALAVLRFQEQLEHMAWLQGGRRQTAPAQRMADFVNARLSFDLPESSYAPGLISSPLHFWLPPSIARRLQLGFRSFGRNSQGFLTNDATVIGVETRTSAPVRILRNATSLCHVRLRGLFPCGEGAGYAGGIVSAAIDGERCAEAVAQMLQGT